MDGGHTEDADVIGPPQSHANDASCSHEITRAPAATVPQKSVAAIGGQSAALATNTSMMSESNDPRRPQQVVKVTDGKQEWDIRNIIGKEVVDGKVHYLVEWGATLVPHDELGKAKVLVDKFGARLQAQCRQRVGKKPGRLPSSKAGRQTIAGACLGGSQQKKGRRKQV